MRIYTYSILRKGLQSKHHLLCISILAALLWASQTLFADIRTLERIAEAERKVSYVGLRLKTFSSSRGTRTFEEVVIHKSVDASYRKVVSVVGGRRDDNENRRDSRERNRDRNEWRQVRSQFSKKEIELIAQNYNLEESVSPEKTTNYETNILTITPKFAGRPTKRIFFARENGVILRVEDLDAEGVLREMFVYTRISFDPEIVERKWEIFQKEIKPEPQRSYSISLAEGEKILRTKPIQPEYLPPGFQLQDIHSIKGRKNTIHLIYTDGLLGFSIFETTDKRARRGSDRRRGSDVIELDGTSVHKHQRGSTHAFSWSSEDIHVVLFGAMPPAEMQKVVESMIQKIKKK